MIGGMSYALVTLGTLQASMTACWVWPEGSVIPDPNALAAWLGMYVGVTPMQAHFILEPYAHHHAQGCYYSPIAQDAYNRLQAHQHPLPPTTRGMPMAPSFTPAVGLAGRLSYPPGTTIQYPVTPVFSTAALMSTGPFSHGCTLPFCLTGGHLSHMICHRPSPYGGIWCHSSR